jgi:hypothetical protein
MPYGIDRITSLQYNQSISFTCSTYEPSSLLGSLASRVSVCTGTVAIGLNFGVAGVRGTGIHSKKIHDVCLPDRILNAILARGSQ